LIGIGGRLTAPPLPHHLAYESVPRRFDRVNPLRQCRAGAGRDRRKHGCAGLAAPPGVMTYANIPPVSWSRPPHGTLTRHGSLAPFRYCRQRYERSLRRIHASRFVSTRGVWQKPKLPRQPMRYGARSSTIRSRLRPRVRRVISRILLASPTGFEPVTPRLGICR
jgi:hypothetical protein